MIKRPTWIMVVVLALIAGLAYYMKAVPNNFIQQALTAGKTPTAVIENVIPPSEGPVNSITISSVDGHSVTLKHESSGWTLSIDAQAVVPADQSGAEQAASQALALRLITASIPLTTSDLTGFGLDSPEYTFQATLENRRTVTFKIGKETITQDGYYIQKEDKTVATVEKFAMDALLNMLKQPPLMFPPTASPTAAELPTGTITPTPAATPTNTPTPGT